MLLGAPRGRRQEKVAGDGRERKYAFHPGKAFADTLAASGGKRVKGKTRPRLIDFLILSGEAVRIEPEWVGVKAWIAMNDKLRCQNHGAATNCIARDFIRNLAGSSCSPYRREETKRFREYRAGIG